MKSTPNIPASDRARNGQGRLHDESGLSLIASLMVLALVGVITAGGITAAMNTLRASSADYRDARTMYAAEAGAEAALSQLKAALRDGYLSDDELEDIEPPPIEGFVMELEVNKDGPVVQEPITDGPFAGLYSLTQNVKIHSTAEDAGGAFGAVELGAKAQAIPLFQFAVFFEGAGEDYAGPTKQITGRMHSNGNLYLGCKKCYFHEMVTTPNRLYRDHRIEHHDPSEAEVYIRDANNNDVKLTFDSEDTTDPAQFKAKSDAFFDGRLQTDAFGVDSLRLPLPEGIGPREILRPIDPGNDTEAERAAKLSWQADMYVTVDLTQHKQYAQECGGGPKPPGKPDFLPVITVARPFGGLVPTDQEKCEIFEFTWEAFFDNHEERWIDPLDVDIADLRTWANSTDDEVSIIYVEFVPPSGSMSPPPFTQPRSDPDDELFPVLRVKDGAQLPGPLSIATDYPIYIWGDYNTVGWYPSALFADTWTALSNAWQDDENWEDTDSKNQLEKASDTYQYMALVIGTGEGYLGCFHEDPEPGCTPLPDPDWGPAGWTRNLENWKNRTHLWRGSFVSLWVPEVATPYGNYPGSNYYKRPDRDYGFDTRYLQPENLPPGTPNVGFVFRAAFREVY